MLSGGSFQFPSWSNLRCRHNRFSESIVAAEAVIGRGDFRFKHDGTGFIFNACVEWDAIESGNEQHFPAAKRRFSMPELNVR